jgi:hypothetical protein
MIRAIVRLGIPRHSKHMEFRIRTQPEEWACTKFCRIPLDDNSIWEFILWLCDRARQQVAQEAAAEQRGAPIWYDPVEDIWGWDAPRQRMAKLLWCHMQRACPDEFQTQFTFGLPDKWADSNKRLSPVQRRLNWVMQGLVGRREQDSKLGQAEWGEHWWLPPEQAKFVRQQLKKTHADLIDHSSEYEEAVCHRLSHYIRHSVKAIKVPCDDSKRIYVGQRSHSRTFVWVKDSHGNKYPLKHGDTPYMEADGTGFEWGYSGHGPSALSRCILIDALDGDLELAETLDRLESGFFEKFILKHPRGKTLRITRTTVHRWLSDVGMIAAYEDRRKTITDSITAHATVVSEKEDLIGRIQETGELRSQRFDVVPESFESALYLDLMRMLELGGAALRCSHCNLPVPYDRSGRANKQRARSNRGLPIYHSECFAHSTRLRKKAYWERRTKSVQFRESERTRARSYREL